MTIFPRFGNVIPLFFVSGLHHYGNGDGDLLFLPFFGAGTFGFLSQLETSKKRTGNAENGYAPLSKAGVFLGDGRVNQLLEDCMPEKRFGFAAEN